MRSIRRFLLLSLLTAITLVIGSAAVYTYFDIKNKINNIFDAQLIEATEVIKYTIAQSALHNISDQKLTEIFSPTQKYLPPKLWDTIYGNQSNRYDIHRVFQVWGKNGHLLARTEGAPIFPLANDKPGFTDSKMGKYTWRVYTLKDDTHDLRYQVAQRMDTRSALIHEMALSNILPDLLLYPVVILFIFITLHLAFKPLKETMNEVHARALDHLKPMNTQSVPLEIKPLIEEFNQLLSRLEESYAREKRFTADAAHELRTPLAALKAQAELINQDKITQAVDRATHVVNQLLTLSKLRPEEGLKDIEIVDLSKLTIQTIVDLAHDALQKKIDLSFDESQTVAQVKANKTLLQILIRNLIDNAIRYTPEHGNIRTYTQVNDHAVIFGIEDSGPGVPEELYDRIFDRFYRQLGTKASGSGLGLSIVQQIANLHHAHIQVSKPEGHSGLKITVLFPKK